jgi:arylsulfatase A-like enzyme
LCDLAHVDKPTDIDGISIVPTLFKDGKQPEHKYLYWEFSAYDQQQAVREGKWKIIRSGVDVGDPPYELYDLSTDIGEEHNVAGEHPDVVARLTNYAKEAHTPSKSFPLLSKEKPKNYVPTKGPKFE